MKLAEGLEVLELRTDAPGNPMLMNAVLIWDTNEAVLIDTGLPGMLGVIREAVEKAGVGFERISKVIVTHQDMDHIGSLSSIKKELGDKVEIISHTEEEPYIKFDRLPVKYTPERLAQVEEQIKSFPGGRCEALKDMFAGVRTEVDRTVTDGEELPYCGGIVVIHTPGHTPGHISLYLKKYKTLVSGDAMNVIGGELVGPAPQYTYDMKKATASLGKLAKYDIQSVICYHGGIFGNNPNKRILELANGNN